MPSPPVLYIAILATDACSYTNGTSLPTYLYTGTQTLCGCSDINGANIVGLPNGSYYISDGTNVRLFSKTGSPGPSDMTAAGSCSVCTVTPTPTPSPVVPTPTPTPTPTVTPTVPFDCSTCGPGTWLPYNSNTCYEVISTPATPPSSPVNLVRRSGVEYSVSGTQFYDVGYTIGGTGTIVSTSSTAPLWINSPDNFVNGPMNRNAIWYSAYTITNTWLGFSTCLSGIGVTNTYYVGIAADNEFKLVLDGVVILDSTLGSMPSLDKFNYWHVYPVIIPAGSHTLELYGLDYGVIAGFGMEIYNNTLTQLQTATSLSDLNIVFSSSGYTVADLVQTTGGVYLSSGYTCPSGYVYSTCSGACLEYVFCIQGATPTPTPTPDPTVTPTVTPTQSPTESVTPTLTPSVTPTQSPTETPTQTPTQSPTETPTQTPTQSPTETPTQTPTQSPTETPTQTPTQSPTESVTPTLTPSVTPTQTPTQTPAPTVTPTVTPSVTPSLTPSVTPTLTPSVTPSVTPSITPSVTPSLTPTQTNTPGFNVQFQDCTNSLNKFRFAVGAIPNIIGNVYYITGSIEFVGCATVITNDGSGPIYDATGVIFTETSGCGDSMCPRTVELAALLYKCIDGTIHYFTVDEATAFVGATYIYNGECYSFVEFSGPGGPYLGTPLYDSCDLCQPTPTPTSTNTPTPTLPTTPTPTPTITNTPLPCLYDEFCFRTSLSSLSGYSGNYNIFGSYASHNSYAGDGILTGYIYYNVDSWCLSDSVGGTCFLQGASPCYSPCPDISSNYFSTGACPTPTPTVTQCDIIDFNAFFNCDLIPTPTPTPSVTCGLINFNYIITGATPTPTPSPTMYCLNVGLDFTMSAYTPSTTPSVTLTPTLTLTKTVGLGGTATFLMLDQTFNCVSVKVLVNCDTGEEIYTSSSLIFSGIPVVAGITMFAQINGVYSCVTYVRDDSNISSNSIVNDVVQIYSTCGSCEIAPTPSVTPTSTITPTVTDTPTSTPTPTITNTVTPSTTLTPTPTSTITLTPTPTVTLPPPVLYMAPISSNACSYTNGTSLPTYVFIGGAGLCDCTSISGANIQFYIPNGTYLYVSDGVNTRYFYKDPLYTGTLTQQGACTPCIGVTPTPTPTPSPSITPTITPTTTPTPSITPTITVTPTITLTSTITPSITPTITSTPNYVYVYESCSPVQTSMKSTFYSKTN